MLSDDIQKLVDRVSEHPNGIWRNKTKSALLTALAAAKMLEVGQDSLLAPKRPLGPANGQIEHDIVTSGCTCLAGMTDPTCPVHSEI